MPAPWVAGRGFAWRAPAGPVATYSSRMPQGSVTGSRQLGARAAEPPGPAIDVARLRVAIARLSRRLRRHEVAGPPPPPPPAPATALPALEQLADADPRDPRSR